MRRVSPTEFYRHFISTHLKGAAPQNLEQLSEDELRNIIKENYPDNPEWLEDVWVAINVRTDKCYISQDDFRSYGIPKHQSFPDFVNNVRAEIDADTFPYAKDIKAGIQQPYPPVIARERETGRFYILDGQKRLITLCYHLATEVRVYLYTGIKRI